MYPEVIYLSNPFHLLPIHDVRDVLMWLTSLAKHLSTTRCLPCIQGLMLLTAMCPEMYATHSYKPEVWDTYCSISIIVKWKATIPLAYCHHSGYRYQCLYIMPVPCCCLLHHLH